MRSLEQRWFQELNLFSLARQKHKWLWVVGGSIKRKYHLIYVTPVGLILVGKVRGCNNQAILHDKGKNPVVQTQV